MFEYIDTLMVADDPEREVLKELFQEVLDHSFPIIVVRIRPSLVEKRRLKEQSLVSGRGVCVFSFTRAEQVPELMHLIGVARPLHISRIQIVIGMPGLPAAIRTKYESRRLSVELVRNGTWLAGMEEFIAGGFDPLDDDLNISGGEALRESVKRIMQRHDQQTGRR